ncbi:MAG: hypothetical protein ABI442_10345 [Gemmatimonadaceae bacterium]
MIRTIRLRAQAISLAALAFISLGAVTSCSDEPLARAAQAPEELALTPLVGRRHNPFIEHMGSPSDSGEWRGTWLLRGHMLAFTAAYLPPGQTENKAYLFGYSIRAKRYFMMVVTAGGSAPDSVNVSWFTIKDKTWRFMPEAVNVNGKAVERQLVWNEKEPTAKAAATIAVEDSSWVLPPARTEMLQYAGWTGRWPSRTNEKTGKGDDAAITGVFDSKSIANGYFLGWFEQNDITVNASKKTSDREVDIWGYSDVTHSYFRVNLVTALDGHAVAPGVQYAPFFSKLGDNGLLLAAPLYKTKVGNESLTSRYGIIRYDDTLYIFEQYLVGGINWTNSPLRQTKWGRFKSAAPDTGIKAAK